MTIKPEPVADWKSEVAENKLTTVLSIASHTLTHTRTGSQGQARTLHNTAGSGHTFIVFHPVKLTACCWESEKLQCRDDVGELDWRASENSLALLCCSPSAAAGANGFSRGRYTKLQWPQTGAGQTLLLTSGISFLPFLFIFFFLLLLFPFFLSLSLIEGWLARYSIHHRKSVSQLNIDICFPVPHMISCPPLTALCTPIGFHCCMYTQGNYHNAACRWQFISRHRYSCLVSLSWTRRQLRHHFEAQRVLMATHWMMLLLISSVHGLVYHQLNMLLILFPLRWLTCNGNNLTYRMNEVDSRPFFFFASLHQ